MDTNFDLNKLKEIAEKSYPEDKHKIGAVLICENSKYFSGFTIRRSTVLGSTCAERMVLDNWYQDSARPKPIKIILVGKILRPNFNETHICYPCGMCRELYHQFIQINKIEDFTFECHSWDLKNNDTKTLKELLYYGKPFYE
ncbi:MAG: hypothetical protein A3D35_02580 [Candidatus Staskawiczbacteria bacterium RIFCSPHIGHO2_02_FULL_34_9]|uniref:CMP/dCMP-type deaminase domain-containing protein n=1 Tax=Candidatus Staskawiczbacteria bacterium RIFCSPHIGHO2_02_FULL_34_9 TaxID=1802206 RepID=A0A1G2I0M7_9BACT|nr:MAG: hypothetical protein A3D35_02580 [Candidatus Staskawiczbacteria bacterium RIFCSPHIGHO2_02_FULL_34_9]